MTCSTGLVALGAHVLYVRMKTDMKINTDKKRQNEGHVLGEMK